MIKNRVEERIEQAVVQMAIDNPALGQARNQDTRSTNRPTTRRHYPSIQAEANNAPTQFAHPPYCMRRKTESHRTHHRQSHINNDTVRQGAGLPKQVQREKPQTNRIYTSFRHKKNTPSLPRRYRPYACAHPSLPCNHLKERQQKRASRKRCSYQLRRVEDGSRTHDTRNHNPVL